MCGACQCCGRGVAMAVMWLDRSMDRLRLVLRLELSGCLHVIAPMRPTRPRPSPRPTCPSPSPPPLAYHALGIHYLTGYNNSLYLWCTRADLIPVVNYLSLYYSCSLYCMHIKAIFTLMSLFMHVLLHLSSFLLCLARAAHLFCVSDSKSMFEKLPSLFQSHARCLGVAENHRNPSEER